MIIEKYTRKRITKIIELFDIRIKKLNEIIENYNKNYEMKGEKPPKYFDDLNKLLSSLDTTNMFLKNLFFMFIGFLCKRKKKIIFSTPYKILIYAGNSARDIIEKIVNIIYNIKQIQSEENDNLDSKIKNSDFEKEVGIEIKSIFNSIRIYGNRCAHHNNPPEGNDILIILEQLIPLYDWFILKYIDKTYNEKVFIIPEDYPENICNKLEKNILREKNALVTNEKNFMLEQKINFLISLVGGIKSLNFNLLIQNNIQISEQMLQNSFRSIIDLIGIHFGIIDNKKEMIVEEIKRNDKHFDSVEYYRYKTIKLILDNKNSQSISSLIFIYKFLLLIIDYYLYLEDVKKYYFKNLCYKLKQFLKNKIKIIVVSLLIVITLVLLSFIGYNILKLGNNNDHPIITINVIKSNDTILVTWDKIEKAENYKLFLKENGKNDTIFNVFSKDTFCFIPDTIRGDFKCGIEAINKNYETIVYADTLVKFIIDSLPFVSNIKIHNIEKIKEGKYYINDDKIILSWDKINKADVYILKLSGRKTIEVNENYYVFNNLDNGGFFLGKDYYLSIYAKNKKFNIEGPKKNIKFYLH